jgi:hypothetical protein
MSCEKFKPALIEAATNGTDLPSAVRAHADACPSCAAELAEQRSLIDAIDASLHRQMNAPVSAATLHRLEAHLAQQAALAPARSPRPRWLYAFAAVAATASTVFLVAHTRSSKPNPRIAQQAPAIQRITPTADARSKTPSILQSRKDISAPRTKMPTTNVSARKEPEVLVPPDDRIALEHFIADLDGREVLAPALARRVPLQELRVAPLDVPDIQTASLTVSPVHESAAIGNR